MKHSEVRVWLEVEEDGREFIRYKLDEGVNISTVLGILNFASQAIFLQQQYDAQADGEDEP